MTVKCCKVYYKFFCEINLTAIYCLYRQDVPKCNGMSDSVFASQEPSDADVDHNVYPDGVVMRRHYKKRRSTTRLSVINGHMYDAEVSLLTDYFVVFFSWVFW